jgi:hypothetical protein
MFSQGRAPRLGSLEPPSPANPVKITVRNMEAWRRSPNRSEPRGSGEFSPPEMRALTKACLRRDVFYTRRLSLMCNLYHRVTLEESHILDAMARVYSRRAFKQRLRGFKSDIAFQHNADVLLYLDYILFLEEYVVLYAL